MSAPSLRQRANGSVRSRYACLLTGANLALGIFFFTNATSSFAIAADDQKPARVKPIKTGAKLEAIYGDLETFADSLVIIENHYVDPVTPRKLVYGALKGMLAALDPYSQFLEPAAHDEIRQETEGKFGGIGVEISVRDGVLSVVTALDDTPAAYAGLLPDDKIVKINGEPTRNLALDEAVKMLRGEPGTEVRMSILREGEGQLVEVSLKRMVIKVKSIKRSGMIDESIGYIRISEFQERTPEDFSRALISLEKQGLKGLVIDLRNNPGGLFPESVKVAEVFVPKDQMIVSTKGRTADQNADFLSSGAEERKAYPIAVLINRGTASAAEIMAGALQDHGLAILVGTRSFGKGSVQTVVPMKDGSALRLTTSRYFTPGGKMIHGIGIAPDIEVPYEIQPDKLAVADEGTVNPGINEIYDQVESTIGASKKPVAAVTLEEIRGRDNQIRRAIEMLKAVDFYKERNAEQPA